MNPMRLIRRIAFLLLVVTVPLLALQRPQGSIARTGNYSIAGTVFNDDGQPLSGVLVRALQPTFDTNGATNLNPAGRSSITDLRGRYTLNGLPPDVYLVSVDPAPGGSRNQLFFTTMYYPGAAEWQSAAPVDLSSGSVVGVNIEVPLRDLVQVGGPILNNVDPEASVLGFYVCPVD